MNFIWAVIVLIRADGESVTKSRRLRAAWHGKRMRIKDGHALTSRTPGWIRMDADGRPQLIPEPAKVVREIINDARRRERLQATGARSPLRGRHTGADMRKMLSGLVKCSLRGAAMTRLVKGGGTYQSLSALRQRSAPAATT